MRDIDTYARDGENRKYDFKPLKELIDIYLEEFSVDIGEFQDYIHHP